MIVNRADGVREMRMMRWGFPEFPGERGVRVNVRHPKSAPWQGRFEVGMRCLVPADAFCEYQDGPSPKARRWFAKPDGKPFVFAGMWTEWEGARGTKKKPVVGKHELFTILTTSPNEIVTVMGLGWVRSSGHATGDLASDDPQDRYLEIPFIANYPFRWSAN